MTGPSRVYVTRRKVNIHVQFMGDALVDALPELGHVSAVVASGVQSMNTSTASLSILPSSIQPHL